MMKFKVGDRVQRKPEYRNLGAWACGDSVLVVGAVTEAGWISLLGGLGEWAGRRFDLAPPLLARDELYMRLRNDAGLSHQHATEFLAACPGYDYIRDALDCRDTTGEVMRRREAARRCGWRY
jgi:hypothetical protein